MRIFWLAPMSLCVTAMLAIESQAQQVVGEVDWTDPAVVSARAAGPLLTAASGFESSGGSSLQEIRLPVIGLLPSELSKVFDAAGIVLESGSGDTTGDVDFSNIKVDTLATSDGHRYDLEYKISPELILSFSGTREFNNLAGDDVVAGGELVQLADGFDPEISEASITFSRFGQVLYDIRLSCNRLEVRTYCSNDRILRQAQELSVLLYAGRQQ